MENTFEKTEGISKTPHILSTKSAKTISGLVPIEIDPKTFLTEHCTLPALPQILTQIQGVMNSDDISIVKISDHINNDPALVAQVLKIVNSAYYSLPKKVGDVKFAVGYLGLKEVYNIILSMSVINTLANEEKYEFNKLWLHSLFSAICTKVLTKKFEPLISIDEMWSPAILHDVGKLVYLKFFPDHYKAISSYSVEQKCLFCEAEEQFPVPPSAYLGMLLCDHWGLPDEIKNACGYHTIRDLMALIERDSSDYFSRMIIIGNLTAILAFDELKVEKQEEISSLIMKSLDITEAEFLICMGEIYELKETAEGLML